MGNFSAQVSEDTELWQRFEEFREEGGFESKSEAVRAAVRRGIENDDETDDVEVGFATGALAALNKDAYPLLRDGLILAAVSLILLIAAGEFATGLVGTLAGVVLWPAVAIGILDVIGAVIGFGHRAAVALGVTVPTVEVRTAANDTEEA